MTDENHWRIIRLTEFARPAAPASTLLQQWYHHLRNLFINTEDTDLDAEAESLPGYRDFAVEPAVRALDAAFASWADESMPGVKFLVGPPHSGTAAIAKAWAEHHQWRCLTPPDAAQLSHVEVADWWQPQAAKQWVIPDFARYWRRHVDDLPLVRALLPQLIRGQFGQGLVVCDSWSFMFLQHAWPVHLTQVYCFAAAEAPLLKQLGVRASAKQLKSLAAQALGNPGLALALWAAQRQGRHEPPCVPAGSGDAAAFVLYTLLLHNGLSGTELQRLLPTLSAAQLDVQLLQLEQAQIVQQEEQQWQVSVHGYLAARDFLKSRGFDVDAF